MSSQHSHYLRKQIIANCRWLLNEEVGIITFVTPSSLPPYEPHYHAAVLSKSSSLESVTFNLLCNDTPAPGNGFTLSPMRNPHLRSSHPSSCDHAIERLHNQVEKIIGGFLRESSPGDLGVNINALAPEYLQVIRSRLPKRQATQNEFSPGPNAKFNTDCSMVAKKLLEKLEILQKGHRNLKRRNEKIQQILTETTSGNLTKLDQLFGDSIGQLTKDNLALLERKRELEGTKVVGSNEIRSPLDIQKNLILQDSDSVSESTQSEFHFEYNTAKYKTIMTPASSVTSDDDTTITPISALDQITEANLQYLWKTVKLAEERLNTRFIKGLPWPISSELERRFRRELVQLADHVLAYFSERENVVALTASVAKDAEKSSSIPFPDSLVVSEPRPSLGISEENANGNSVAGDARKDIRARIMQLQYRSRRN